ncbi:MAG: hypothetical protein GW815_03335 [Candidatus Moranbacteria bacterium]|nr:hypothetical protein [Candidatus Moranbacteria bacterium]
MARLTKEHKKKYQKELGWDEKLIRFAAKTVGSIALVFLTAVGMDIYHFLK